MNISTDQIHDRDGSDRLVRQHLIDPELCLACGSCQSVCPEGAIEMDFATMRYAVDPERCTNEHECLSVCSSDAIKAWRMVPAERTYTLEEQFGWEELPPLVEVAGEAVVPPLDEEESPAGNPAPATAAQPVTYLYTHKSPVSARVHANVRVTDGESDIHHIVLDFGDSDFPWLEGQNVGVLPPGTDGSGRAHPMRAYSIASERNGEEAGTRRLALTVKRVIDEWQGQPYHGIASNYLCDLAPGSEVRCVGPIGERFLMPEAPDSRILMICTGTGIAPMRSFIQRRERLAQPHGNPPVLFYGGRRPGEMAYYDELKSLPGSHLVTRMALSRDDRQPRRYVQDLLLAHADLVWELLSSPDGHIFICGLVAMEQGVMDALAVVAARHGENGQDLLSRLRHEGRLQIETY